MLSIKIANVVPLSDMQLLVFFENGVIKKFDVKPIIKDYPEFEALKEPALFQMVKVEPGGYGVSWDEDLDAPRESFGRMVLKCVYQRTKLFLKSDVARA